MRTPWGQGAEAFEFVLNSPADIAGFHHKEVAGPRIREPERFQKTLFDKLERLRAGLDFDGHDRRDEAVHRDLVALGQDLFLEVFAGEMGRIYQDCRDRVRTLFITSDEPWIPWEILHGGAGDDFFASRFQMGRWLSGQSAPVFEKQCRHGLFLGGTGDLMGATDELDFLRQLWLPTEGFDAVLLDGATAGEFEDHLEQRNYDLLHFAGHGHHEPARAAESRLEMRHGPLRVDHLSLEWAERLCASRPFVFSNACQVGRIEHSLAGLDGWAARWVRRFGCSAYLAPLWSVEDQEAGRFTSVLYERLAAGLTLGEAVLEARRDLQTSAGEDLTWAAYSVYGHPNMRVYFGDASPKPDRVTPPRPSPATPPPPRPRPPRPRKWTSEPRRRPSAAGSPGPERPTRPEPPVTTQQPTGEKPLQKAGLLIAALALCVALGSTIPLWRSSESNQQSADLDAAREETGESGSQGPQRPAEAEDEKPTVAPDLDLDPEEKTSKPPEQAPTLDEPEEKKAAGNPEPTIQETQGSAQESNAATRQPVPRAPRGSGPVQD
ncbi:MAG: CHAT domain-containing protein, partial [Acidobacteriota bacterium]